MTRDVGKYVDDCNICQRMKNCTEVLVEKLKLSKLLKKLWIYLTVDFITNLLLVAGKNVILVMCDRLSKIIHFVITTKRTSTKRLVQLFRDNVWKLHKLSESVVSN